ncbi:MAG: DNA-binding response regulator, partial [Nitrospirae bacterium]
MKRPIRMCLADDDARTRERVRRLLDPDIQILDIGPLSQAVERAAQHLPDVVILRIDDYHQGQTLIPALRQRVPSAKILVLTPNEDPAFLHALLQAGASGFVCHEAEKTDLLVATQALAEGRMFLDVCLGTEIKGQLHALWGGKEIVEGHHVPLSPRERQVLRLVALGHTNQEIAGMLGLSIKSVESYRARVMDKLDCRTRAELVRYAEEH